MTPRTRRRLARVIFVCVLLLVASAAIVVIGSSRPSPPASPPVQTSRPLFVDTKCADLVVLGLRGSGQSQTRNAGVGGEVFKSVQDMASRLHARSNDTVRLEAVSYQAANVGAATDYRAGVDDGRRRLRSQFAMLSKDCRDTKVAVVGFSQGAQVVHEFAYDLTAGQSRNLVLVGMIADPLRNPADTISEWSYASKPTTGHGSLGPGPRFGPATHRVAITFCVEGDEVCNRPGGPKSNTPSATHRHFYEKATSVRSTGERLIAILHRNGFG